MELDKFIEETLINIQRGIKNANIKIAKDEGKQERTNGEMQYMLNGPQQGRKDGIVFDVAVTVTSEKSTDGGGKINVASVVSLGGGKSVSGSEEHVSRIKFEIDPFNSVF